MTDRERLKVAYLVEPHAGGTFSVFRQLRRELLPRGLELRFVSYYKPHRRDEPPEHEAGEWVEAGSEKDPRGVCCRLVAHLLERGYQQVMVNVLSHPGEMLVARHLPPDISRVMVMHTISRAALRAAAELRPSVNRTVAVSPRVRQSLLESAGFGAGEVEVVFNGVELKTAALPDRPAAPLQLAFVGRLDEAAKGILWLPELLDELRDVELVLRVAGDGPDRGRLLAALARHGGRARWEGRLEAAEVHRLLRESHLLVFPSRFEGLGLSVIEAMEAGCVPVASRIRGVTDEVIEDGVSGRLFPVGDMAAAAACVRELAADPSLRRRMAEAGRARVRERFSAAAMGEAYARLLRDAQRSTAPLLCRPLAEWTLPRAMRPGLSRYVPESVKNLVRRWTA